MEYETFDRWLSFLEKEGWIKVEGESVEPAGKFLVELSEALALVVNELLSDDLENARKTAMVILALRALKKADVEKIADLAMVFSALVKTFCEPEEENIVEQILRKIAVNTEEVRA